MAIITRANFTARGKLQNVIIQTYHNGKIVMRSKPLKYRKSVNQASIFNRKTMTSALLITTNWYISFGQFYFNPPPPYERTQACFLGLLRKYQIEIGQQNNIIDAVKLASSNMSFCNALPDKRLSFSTFQFSGTFNFGILNFDFFFNNGTNPNDEDEDLFSICCVCTNTPEPMQTLQQYDNRALYRAFGSFFIENYSPTKQYVVFCGYVRPDGIDLKNAYFSNFYGYFAIVNNILYTVQDRIYLQGIPF